MNKKQWMKYADGNLRVLGLTPREVNQPNKVLS